MDWVFIWLGQNAATMTFAGKPFAFVLLPIVMREDADALFFIIDKGANEAITIVPLKRTLSVAFAFEPVACELVAVMVKECAIARLLALDEIALVPVAVGMVEDAVAMLFIVDERADKAVAIGLLEGALPMALSIDKSTCVLVPIRLDQSAIAVALAIYEVTRIRGSVLVVHHTLSSELVLLELADIPLTIAPDPFALPVALVGAGEDLAVVSVPVRPSLVQSVEDEIVVFVNNLLDGSGRSHVLLVEERWRDIRLDTTWWCTLRLISHRLNTLVLFIRHAQEI